MKPLNGGAVMSGRKALVRLDSLSIGDEYRDIVNDNDGNPKTLYIGTVIGRHESGKVIIQTLEHADLIVEKIEQE